MHIGFSIFHESVVSACLNEKLELVSKLYEYLVFNLCLFDGQVKDKLFFLLIKLMFKRVAKNLEDIKFSGLIKAKHLDALVLLNHLLVELDLVQMSALHILYHKLPSIFHLKVPLSVH